MSAPPPGDGYGQQYGQPQPPDQLAYDDQQPQATPTTSATPQPEQAYGKKKKRAYAAQAFEVGAGANAAVGGQTQGGGQPYGVPPAQPGPGYGGYPQAVDPQPAAAQGYQYPQAYGAPQPGTPQTPAYGGYQAPDQAYAAPGALQQPGVAAITQGMAGMQMGGQPQPAPGAGQAPRPVALNQLYPTDLLNQPFNVSELDLPPPPIVLPPNVS